MSTVTAPTKSVKNGKARSGIQRFLCRLCGKSFQLDYLYNTNQPGTHEKIIQLTHNGFGVRDIERVLAISRTTVIAHLKNSRPPQVTLLPFEQAKVELICEMDEQWSFVSDKKNQRWLWYAWEPRFKRIIAHAFGRRTEETLKKLLKLLEPYQFEFYCTDDWKSY